jgi:hypothetical protein
MEAIVILRWKEVVVEHPMQTSFPTEKKNNNVACSYQETINVGEGSKTWMDWPNPFHFMKS